MNDFLIPSSSSSVSSSSSFTSSLSTVSLDSKARKEIKSSDELFQLIQEQKLNQVKQLVNEKTDLRMVNLTWISPLTESFNQYLHPIRGGDHAFQILLHLVQHWQFPDKTQVNHWVDKYLRFVEEETWQKKAAEIAVNHLLGVNVTALYTKANLEKYIGHLRHYEGKVTDMKIGVPINLSYWSRETFLALRVRGLFALLATVSQQKEVAYLIELVKKELYCTVCAYFVSYINKEINRITNPGKAAQLRSVLIDKILNLFQALADKEECILPVGWEEHNIYLCLVKIGKQMVLRLDNLGMGYGAEFHKDKPDQKFKKPYVIAVLPIDNPHAVTALTTYLQRLLGLTSKTEKGSGLDRATILKQIYDRVSPKIFTDYPKELGSLFYLPIPIQSAPNCTIANFQQGLRYRTHDPFIEALLRAEINFCAEYAQEPYSLDHVEDLPLPLSGSRHPFPYGLEQQLLRQNEQLMITPWGGYTPAPRPVEHYYSPVEIVLDEKEKSVTGPKVVSLIDRIVQDFDEPMVLIGPSGVGKTTLCRYIESQWGKAKTACQLPFLRDFTAVLYIPIAHLSQTAHYTTLLELLNHLCFAGKLSSLKKLFFLDNALKAKRILLLLDGAHEFASIGHKSHAYENYQLLLNYKTLILTSQPHALPNREQFQQCYKIRGFTPPTVRDHVKKLFPDQGNVGQRVLSTLEATPYLRELCRSPLLLELYSALMKETDHAPEILSKGTLFIEMIGHLLKLHLRSCSLVLKPDLTDLQSVLKHLFAPVILNLLGKLALLHIELMPTVLDENQIELICRQHGTTRVGAQDALAFSALRVAGRDQGGRINAVYFAHQSFRDGLAAYLLRTRIIENEPRVFEDIARYRYDLRYRSVWPLVVRWLVYHEKESKEQKQEKQEKEEKYEKKEEIQNETASQPSHEGPLARFIAHLVDEKNRDICGFFELPLLWECLGEYPQSSPLPGSLHSLQQLLDHLAAVLCDPTQYTRYSLLLAIAKDSPALLQRSDLVNRLLAYAKIPEVLPGADEKKEVKGEDLSDTAGLAICHLAFLVKDVNDAKKINVGIHQLFQHVVNKEYENYTLLTQYLTTLVQWQKISDEFQGSEFKPYIINWPQLLSHPLLAPLLHRLWVDQSPQSMILMKDRMGASIESIVRSSSKFQQVLPDIKGLEPFVARPGALTTEKFNSLLPKLIHFFEQQKTVSEDTYVLAYSLGIVLQKSDDEEASSGPISKLQKRLGLEGEEKNETDQPKWPLLIAIVLLISSKDIQVVKNCLSILKEKFNTGKIAQPWMVKAVIQYSLQKNFDEFKTILKELVGIFDFALSNMPEQLLYLSIEKWKWILLQKESLELSSLLWLMEPLPVEDLMEIYLSRPTDNTFNAVLSLLAKRQIAIVQDTQQQDVITLFGGVLMSAGGIRYTLEQRHREQLTSHHLSSVAQSAKSEQGIKPGKLLVTVGFLVTVGTTLTGSPPYRS